LTSEKRIVSFGFPFSLKEGGGFQVSEIILTLRINGKEREDRRVEK